jgi:hypothetical protein
MGTTLTGTTIQDTYDALIKVGDNGPLSATAKLLSDGLGNDSILALSTTAVGVGFATPTARLQVRGTGATAATTALLVDNSAGTAALTVLDSLTSSFGGSLAVGLATPTARLHVKGTGSTSGTTALRIENSAGTAALTISDNGFSAFAGTVTNATGPIQALSFNAAGTPFNFGTAAIYGITGTLPVVTSGQRDGFLGQFTFAPTSGTTILNIFNASPTINQTGGANGITRGLFINPTLTSAADFRAIEVTNGGAYINTTSVNASAILQSDSTTKGFLPPRMTTTQKNAIATPAAGLVVYDTTLNKLCVYTTAWETITSI